MHTFAVHWSTKPAIGAAHYSGARRYEAEDPEAAAALCRKEIARQLGRFASEIRIDDIEEIA